MEDDPDAYKKKYTKNQIETNFKVDYIKSEYKDVFERIGRLFEGSYLNFIKMIKDPIIKEIYILLRKYQYFFTRLEMNKTILFDFTKSSDCILNNLHNHYEEENCLNFYIKILPKFKKNEINFTIPNDILECKFKIYFDEENVVKETKIEILNIKTITEYNQLIEMMNQNLSKFVTEDFKDNFIIGLNKFITYVENYLPELHKKVLEKQILGTDFWNQDEQNRLEEAVKTYQNEKNVKDKFKKIAEFVRTKSFSECVKRYKKLANLNKNNDAKVEVKDEEKDAEKVEAKDEVKNVSNLIVDDQKIIEKESYTKNKNKEIKIILPLKTIEIKPTPEPELLIIPPKKEQNTSDLVDDIINQFNSLYGNLKLETQINQDLNQKDVYLKSDEDIYEENENDFSDEFEVDEMQKKNESRNNYRNYRDEDDPRKDNIKIQNSTPNVNPKHLELVKSIFKMGEKHTVTLSALIINNIALGEIVEPNLFLKCSKCKKVSFESHFTKFNKKFNIFYMGVICPKCNSEMHLIFKSELLHQGNLTTAGVIFSSGVTIIDILNSNYQINCLKCPETYKKINIRTGGIPTSDKNCRQCGDELTFFIYTASILPSTYNDYSFLDNFEIQNFQRINHHIESEDNFVKKFDKIIQVGTPLPDKGTCKHYKQSFRWFRFGCCGKISPCDTCHDEINDHEADYARTILCGHCAFEQTSQSKLCCKCGKGFTLEDSGRGFWEGGKGCRNKSMMSSKDNHKFTSVNKTISRKKREEMNKK